MEEKIKIYISKEINNILLKDMELFEFYKKDNTLNKNDFINTLIINYYETYQNNSSVLYDRIKDTLVKRVDSDELEIVDIAYELLQYIETNTLRLENVKMDALISLKPTKKSGQIINYIQQCLLQGTTMSNYFRNMFASYVLLPQDKREQIIFKEKFDTINEAISSNRKVYFTTKQNDAKHIVSPFAISNSKEELFNYMIVEYKDKPYSFRLSRINKIIILNEQSSFIEKNIPIFNKMMQYGPQFAYSDDSEICVRLTDRGKEMFRKIYLHRPKPIRIEEDCYYFDCSRNQVSQYFFRFGKHAYVESPKDLTGEMHRNYVIAAKAYAKKNKGEEDEKTS